MTDEVRNARIKEARLGFDDHNLLTAVLHLDYGDGSVQGFGGYQLEEESIDKPPGVYDFGTAWLREVLETVGVSAWGLLIGKYLRVRIRKGLITAIGHIVEDRWFDPKELWDKMVNENR